MTESFTKKKLLAFLPFLFLPVVISLYERIILRPLVSVFDLAEPSQYLLRISTSTIIILLFAIFLGKSYGLEINKKLKNILAGQLILFLIVCYFFLYVLKIKNFFTPLAIVHVFNWSIGVFREELVLRGIIQTEAAVFKGKLLGISYSIWIATLVFSVWHLVNLVVWPWQTVAIQMITCIPLGIILGLIKEKTNNTLITYFIHITGDLFYFSMYMLLFGKLFFQLY